LSAALLDFAANANGAHFPAAIRAGALIALPGHSLRGHSA
jgi:hypothetical protein